MRKLAMGFMLLALIGQVGLAAAQDNEPKKECQGKCCPIEFEAEAGVERGMIRSLGLWSAPESNKVAMMSGISSDYSLLYKGTGQLGAIGLYFGTSQVSQVGTIPMYMFSYMQEIRFGLDLRSVYVNQNRHSMWVKLKVGGAHSSLSYSESVMGDKPVDRWGVNLGVGIEYRYRLGHGLSVGVSPFLNSTAMFGTAGDAAIEKPDSYGSYGLKIGIIF